MLRKMIPAIMVFAGFLQGQNIYLNGGESALMLNIVLAPFFGLGFDNHIYGIDFSLLLKSGK